MKTQNIKDSYGWWLNLDGQIQHPEHTGKTVDFCIEYKGIKKEFTREELLKVLGFL